VIAKGSGEELIVRDNVDRSLLVARMGKAVLRYRWSCLAYCLLDTHFHVVLGTPAANLGLGMQWLLAPYARAFNKRHERQGNVFQTRFYSKQIRSDDHLLAALLYVHLNPVRAGVVDEPELWPWGSYAPSIGQSDPPAFLDLEGLLELIAPEPSVAQRRLRAAAHETLRREISAPVSDTVSDT
jgi:REP element-mobilizing transposase RayT